MELSALRYFRTIATMGHMTRAAQVLGVTQPALSASMKKLEAEIGAPLLDRTGRGVALTEAGRVFLEHVTDALRQADAGAEAVRRLVGLEEGSIRVGGGATATASLLPPVVSAVRKRFPGVRFYVREAGSAAVATAVLTRELDLGIVTVPLKGKWGLPGAEDLLVTPLVDDELRLITPPGPLGFKARKAGEFRWEEIAGHPFVAFEGGTAVRAIIDQAAAAAGVRLNVVMELRSIESIKQMVAAGIGVGLVSRLALRPGEGLVCRGSVLTRALAVVRRRDRVPSPAVAAFERELRDRWRPAR
ncbi:MAG: LysR family transcriptional regulator [Tepidisphaera sp.]